jgi:hypothetical protein
MSQLTNEADLVIDYNLTCGSGFPPPAQANDHQGRMRKLRDQMMRGASLRPDGPGSETFDIHSLARMRTRELQ